MSKVSRLSRRRTRTRRPDSVHAAECGTSASIAHLIAATLKRPCLWCCRHGVSRSLVGAYRAFEHTRRSPYTDTPVAGMSDETIGGLAGGGMDAELTQPIKSLSDKWKLLPAFLQARAGGGRVGRAAE